MRNGDLQGTVCAMTLRCVIVDDSPAFVTAARSLLERQGVTVLDTTATGAGAERLAADLHPDVMLVDIDLGAESGFDIARRMAGLNGPPVILISTYAEEDYADLIAGSPALGFIPKAPLSAAAVERMLDGAGRPSSGTPGT
jgi:DNA-binding NarL/FixJ family response regulator